MLESAEIGHVVSKAAFARHEPQLREALLNAQYDLAQEKRRQVLLIVTGVEGGGRSETANKLTEWMDPRHIRVIAFGPRGEEERSRPPAWRYWRALPPHGRIGIFLNAWYTEMVTARISGDLDKVRFEFYLQETRAYERMLVDEGVVLLKFWIHLSKDVL
ncbi:MAG: polyphosphate:AMP phosphotransferase, partial [Casimicrobiaceae bacterium]